MKDQFRLKGVSVFVYAIVVTSIFLLQACSTVKQKLYADYSVEPIGIEDELQREDVKNCVGDQQTTFTENQRKDCILLRNNKITNWIVLSDEKCEAHKKTIYGNEALYNILFGSMTNISSGLGTIFSNVALKTIFSAGALFSNSERSLVNETVYKTMVVSAIVEKITDDREKTKTTIIANLKDTNLAYERYPINAAFVDVISYHYQCSFMYGLQKALKEGTQNTSAQRISELKSNLNELELQMKSRAEELRKALTDDTIKGDPVLTQLKTRYDAIAKELTSLQSSSPQGTPSTSPSSDTTPPTVTSFDIPSTASSLKVAIRNFEATDNVGVTGYMVTESSIAPAASAKGWSDKPPTNYLFKTAGTKTLYPWAKDRAGNISLSTSMNKNVTITLPGKVRK